MRETRSEELAINTIRTLSIDAVQAANSGHPGTPMALAPLVYVLWNRILRFDPKDPIWPNRDRFVLSNGHASMLLWSLLYLTETRAVNADYETLGQPSVSLEDIRRFRQLGSKAPGHPEYHWVSGVETTTGPLGQGIATSVGMAIAEKWLAHRYNRPGFGVFDYDVYAICGDGCLMEGIGSEAASLAGHLGLDNLCWVYDNNHITIEGNTRITFTEDVAARFLAYDWNVLRVGDANDIDRIQHAYDVFRKTTGRPTLIILDSHIGYGSPHRQDTAAAHGEPLGEEESIQVSRARHRDRADAKAGAPRGMGSQPAVLPCRPHGGEFLSSHRSPAGRFWAALPIGAPASRCRRTSCLQARDSDLGGYATKRALTDTECSGLMENVHGKFRPLPEFPFEKRRRAQPGNPAPLLNPFGRREADENGTVSATLHRITLCRASYPR